MTDTNLIYTCPSCQSQYLLGRTGTVDGCDKCQGIERNPLDGSIIQITVFGIPVHILPDEE